MLSELGRHAEALSSFDRALAINAKSAPDWLNRGATLHAHGPRGRGDRELRPRHRARCGARPCRIFNRANVLHELGRFDEALAGYDRALALAPKLAHAHRGRAAVALAHSAATEERARGQRDRRPSSRPSWPRRRRQRKAEAAAAKNT